VDTSYISYIAMHRVVEETAAKDEVYRKRLAKTGKVLLSDARKLSDEQVLDKLRSLNLEVHREFLAQQIGQLASAEEISQPLSEHVELDPRCNPMLIDWVWLGLTVLWERWFPDEPSLEMLDDRIRAGYDLQRTESSPEQVSEVWITAWAWVLRIMERRQINSITEFDRRFRGTQSVFNWVQDLADKLRECGPSDPEFLRARIKICERSIPLLADDLTIENMRRWMAESYFELGQPEKTDELFREWLTNDPRWGFGWIGWADCYAFPDSGKRDLTRAAEILDAGLAIPHVRDVTDLVNRHADVFDDLSLDPDEAYEYDISQGSRLLLDDIDEWRQSIPGFEGGRLSAGYEEIGPRYDPDAPSAAPAKAKVGRNEPCPCESGKKFKKCCGST
jgi:hypothetical protein